VRTSNPSQLLIYSGNCKSYMELKGSLPCSQEPATDSYSKPDEFSPHSYPISLRSILIFCDLLLGFPNDLFPSGFPNRPLYVLLCHACYKPSPFHPTCFDHSDNSFTTSTTY
jgi:hypothetical protein